MARRPVPTVVIEAGLVLACLGLLVPAGILGWVIGHSSSGKTETVTVAGPTTGIAGSVDPQEAAGAHLFVQFACAQCHGLQGRGGVSPDVPALTNVATTLTPAQLRKIINHGLGESANPTKPYMPVWGEVISQSQVNDLISYLRAGLPHHLPHQVRPCPRLGEQA